MMSQTSSASSVEESDEHSRLLDNSMVLASPTEVRSMRGERQPGSTWITASLIMINATLGGGLLNFPGAFNAGGGIFSSMMMQIVLALLAGFSFIIISWVSDIRACVTYQDTVGSVCGFWAKNICALTMILYTYGSCVAYFIIVGDESDRASLLLILPFCYAKKIDFLKYASGLATVGILYFVFLIVYVYITRNTDVKIEIKIRPDHWTDIFKVIPTVCFAYQSHLSVVPTYACMEKRSLKPLGIAVLISMTVAFVSYSLVGIFGYLTYGTKIQSDLLSSMSVNNLGVGFGFFVFAVKVFLTYPVMEFVGREAIESSWTQIFKLDRVQIILGERIRRFWFATLWFASSLFIGLCLMNTIFLLETTFESSAIKRIAYAIAVGYILIGVFIFGLTIAQFVEDFVEVHKSPVAQKFSLVNFRDTALDNCSRLHAFVLEKPGDISPLYLQNTEYCMTLWRRFTSKYRKKI
uniref:Amino acid transporter transmembrane domain-containing protein n=1 Tax=Romanomermis culicivorax TaxID=13658 RepID=A0A915KLF8_ROMCU